MVFKMSFVLSLVLFTVVMGLYQLGFVQDNTAFRYLDSVLNEFDSSVSASTDVPGLSQTINFLGVDTGVPDIFGFIAWFASLGLALLQIILFLPWIMGDVLQIIGFPSVFVMVGVTATSIIEVFGALFLLLEFSRVLQR